VAIGFAADALADRAGALSGFASVFFGALVEGFSLGVTTSSVS
jgi:hypothetical protein